MFTLLKMWFARQTHNGEVVGSSPIKGPRSTGWFQKWIRA